MSKHTPAPWFVHDGSDAGKPYHTVTATEDQNGWVGGRYFSVSGCIDALDARLIAAAPDMLGVLKNLDAHLSILMGNIRGSAKVDHRWEGMEELVRGWREEITTAIAKAEGK